MASVWIATNDPGGYLRLDRVAYRGNVGREFCSLHAGTRGATSTVQYELYKWVKRESDENTALDIIALSNDSLVVP